MGIRKRTLIALLIAALSVTAALAAGGAEETLVSLSYLQGTFLSQVEQAVAERTGQSAEQAPLYWQEHRLKAGDTLTGGTGTGVLVLAGGVRLSGGSVIDVTQGTEVLPGTALVTNHRYLTAEDTTAYFTVTSKTAVVDTQGTLDLQPSGQTDYNAMAAALKDLHLLRGSFTGFGEGFDLEVAPTRLQALIMFIRVLGEEEQALSWRGTTPFSDIERGSQAEQYVGYAYEKGYTNGYTATQFRPALGVNAYQYTEFVLRAMGYSSAANTNLADTLERAQGCGLLTFGEAEMLRRDPFLRAELVYISYYSLETLLPDGTQTLRGALMDKGVFTHWEWERAMSRFVGLRL